MNEIKDLKYVIIPTALYELDLNATEIKLIGTIISYNFDEFYFTNEQLAKMLKTSITSIVRAVIVLKEMGLIETKYKIKSEGGKIRIIKKTEKLLNMMRLCNIEKSDYAKMNSRTMQNCKENNNKLNNIKINNNITPPNINNIPPLKGGDCQIVNNSVDNSKQENNPNSDKQDSFNFHLNERKWASDETLGSGAYETQGTTEKGLKNENNESNKVNWDNCRNDNQRLMAFWVQLEHPELYKNATKEQAQEFFKRFTRDSSSILKMAGNLEIAKEAVKACRDWLRSKKLEYNLTTIARNIGKFLDETIRKYQLPPETDLFLFEEYRKLYKELKGQELPKLELIKLIKQKLQENGKNVNQILEDGIKKIKEKLNSEIANNELNDIIKKVAEKVSINQHKEVQ